MTLKRGFCTFLLLIVAVSAFGQAGATTATIRGKVTSESGTGIANAEINAVDASSGFVMTVNSRADGNYTLAGLKPGTYNIVVAAPGYEPRSEDVRVLIGQSLSMDLKLSATSVLKETITVVGNQAIETKTSEVATNVTQQQMENLPQDERNFLNFAALAPGIRLSTNPERKTFAGDAQDAEQTNVFIDGISTKNDVLLGGTVGQDASRGNPFPQSAVQEFRVITQNYSAQYDHASSAIITAITRSGGNDFNGNAFVFYQPKSWISDTEKGFGGNTLTGNDDYSRLQPGVSFGGPLIRDKLHFFATYEGTTEQAKRNVVVTIPQYQAQFSQYTGSFDAPFKANLLFGKLSLQAIKNQLVDLSVNWRRENEVRDFGNQDSFESARDFKNYVYGTTLRHQWNSSSSLNEALISLQKFGWNPDRKTNDLVGRRYFTPSFSTVIRIGGSSTSQEFTQQRIELRDNFNFAPMELARGTHNFQVGGNIDFMKYHVNKNLNGNPEYKFLPDANGVFGNIPFEVDYGIGNPHLDISNNQYGIYGQDTWNVNNRLTLNLGLRWDYEAKMINTDYVTPANIVTALKGKSFPFDGRTISIPDEYFSTGSEREPFLGAWQPRFGFTYDVKGDSRSVVYGGFGRYYDRIFLNGTLDEQFRLQFPVYRFNFNPTTWKPEYFTAAGLNGLIAQGNTRPEIYLLSNNTKPPYSNQYNIGYRQTMGSWVGGLAYNVVRAKRGLTYVAASGTCCGAFAPGFGAVILNDPKGKSFWYDGQSVTLERPYTGGNGWGVRFVYTHSKAQQDGNDLFSLDLPSASLYKRHAVPGSQPNVFGATGIIGLPMGFRASTNVTWGSGGAAVVEDFRFGFSLAQRLQSGVRSDANYPDNGYRNVDFRLQKDFGFAGRNLSLIAEVFNAFNFSNFGCLSTFRAPDTNPATLGTPGCVISLGRRFQAGAKFNF
jgi:hypothetical protein